MNKKSIILIGVFIVLRITACKSTQNNTNTSDSLLQKSESGIEIDSIILDTTVYPTDNNCIAKVLTTGTFHNDEVNPDDNQTQWFGLFSSRDKYYLKQTLINITNVYDPILDQDDEATGWEVTTEHTDTCLILIEQLPFLTDRNIENILLQKNEIYPQDTIKFEYCGRKYYIYATGLNKEGNILNYKLYLITTIDNKAYKTLLVSMPFFDGKMINIIFAGDIDGDNILDLLIDTSNHYNGERLTVYLSKPATNQQLITPIGMHLSVGC